MSSHLQQHQTAAAESSTGKSSVGQGVVPEIRKPSFDPGKDLTQHWVNGRPFDTYFLNTFHLMFPDGERFFIRSVQHFAPGIEDKLLRNRIKGFLGQEVQHGVQHEACWNILKDQGYPVERYLRFFRWISFDVVERLMTKVFGPRVNLAVTAAMEHGTAVLAEVLLTTGWMDKVSPGMRDLMTWHACEEIEHKDVAYDTLSAIKGGYILRMFGMSQAMLMMGMIIASGILFCAWHDRELRFRHAFHLVVLDPIRFLFRLRRVPFMMAQYLVPGFHPNKIDNRALAAAALPV